MISAYEAKKLTDKARLKAGKSIPPFKESKRKQTQLGGHWLEAFRRLFTSIERSNKRR